MKFQELKSLYEDKDYDPIMDSADLIMSPEEKTEDLESKIWAILVGVHIAAYMDGKEGNKVNTDAIKKAQKEIETILINKMKNKYKKELEKIFKIRRDTFSGHYEVTIALIEDLIDKIIKEKEVRETELYEKMDHYRYLAAEYKRMLDEQKKETIDKNNQE